MIVVKDFAATNINDTFTLIVIDSNVEFHKDNDTYVKFNFPSEQIAKEKFNEILNAIDNDFKVCRV